MKASKNTSQNEQANRRSARQRATTWQGDDSEIRAISKEYENPVTYDHPYPSMKRFAEFLALRYDCTRTCHAYYRQVRLLQSISNPSSLFTCPICRPPFASISTASSPKPSGKSIRKPGRRIAAPAAMHCALRGEQRMAPCATHWGVHIQPAGSGASALKYLGRYVARTAIADSRILDIGENTVTFRWKDRSHHNRPTPLTLSGVEFVRRYLRHVLPQGLRSIRYYGFCHPTAKAKRMRVRLHAGSPVQFGAVTPAASCAAAPTATVHPCPKCGGATRLLICFPALRKGRGPPADPRPSRTIPAA